MSMGLLFYCSDHSNVHTHDGMHRSLPCPVPLQVKQTHTWTEQVNEHIRNFNFSRVCLQTSQYK